MIKTAQLLIVLALFNSFYLIPSARLKKAERRAAHIDYKLKPPAYAQPAVEITGYAALAAMSYSATKYACAALASSLYPNAIKGALPTASAADKNQFDSAMNFIAVAPVAVSLLGWAYKSWPVAHATWRYKKLYDKKQTFKQLGQDPAKLSTKESDWEEITTKPLEQILAQDDAKHMALWIKQNKHDINKEDNDGRTLLHRVLLQHKKKKNDLKIATMLLNKGAKIDGFKKRSSLLTATYYEGLQDAYNLIKSSRANCSCSH